MNEEARVVAGASVAEDEVFDRAVRPKRLDEYRSQYEHFTAYHESFYRRVEATSLTPFSGPAIERGLAGTLVAMGRLADPVLTPPLHEELLRCVFLPGDCFFSAP